MSGEADILERALVALNALCGERPWRAVTLRDVAEKAGIPLADLYREANSKTALIDHLGEPMEPWRAVLAGVEGSAVVPLLPHLPRAARAILEAAGVEATAPRLAAMTAVWARIVQVWRADEGALNRTMAEIDKRLKQLRTRLNTVGQGF